MDELDRDFRASGTLHAEDLVVTGRFLVRLQGCRQQGEGIRPLHAVLSRNESGVGQPRAENRVYQEEEHESGVESGFLRHSPHVAATFTCYGNLVFPNSLARVK